MEVHCLEIDGHTIEFALLYKQGAELVAIFHGYGQSFNDLKEAADFFFNKGFSVLMPNLFFHGNSRLQTHAHIPISTAEWVGTFAKLLQRFQYSHLRLFGFSMGARFVLAYYKHYPEHVHRLYLIAPDGIKRNPWNILGTSTNVGRSVFRYFMHKPAALLRLSRLLAKLNMLNKSRQKFVEAQLTLEQERLRVLYTWITFRKLHLKPSMFLSLLKEHRTKTIFFYGKYDRVITADSFPKKLLKSTNTQLYLLDCGHNKVVQSALRILDNQL
jgi:pimeloyl-ACP methyl ester carboxylesterase